VKTWDPNDDLKDLAELKGHKGCVRCVAVHPKSKLIASGDDSGVVKLWELVEEGSSWTENKDLKDNSDLVLSVVFNPDGNWLATAGHDKKIRMYDVANDFSRSTPWRDIQTI